MIGVDQENQTSIDIVVKIRELLKKVADDNLRCLWQIFRVIWEMLNPHERQVLARCGRSAGAT